MSKSGIPIVSDVAGLVGDVVKPLAPILKTVAPILPFIPIPGLAGLSPLLTKALLTGFAGGLDKKGNFDFKRGLISGGLTYGLGSLMGPAQAADGSTLTNPNAAGTGGSYDVSDVGSLGDLGMDASQSVYGGPSVADVGYVPPAAAAAPTPSAYDFGGADFGGEEFLGRSIQEGVDTAPIISSATPSPGVGFNTPTPTTAEGLGSLAKGTGEAAISGAEAVGKAAKDYALKAGEKALDYAIEDPVRTALAGTTIYGNVKSMQELEQQKQEAERILAAQEQERAEDVAWAQGVLRDYPMNYQRLTEEDVRRQQQEGGLATLAGGGDVSNRLGSFLKQQINKRGEDGGFTFDPASTNTISRLMRSEVYQDGPAKPSGYASQLDSALARMLNRRTDLIDEAREPTDEAREPTPNLGDFSSIPAAQFVRASEEDVRRQQQEGGLASLAGGGHVPGYALGGDLSGAFTAATKKVLSRMNDALVKKPGGVLTPPPAALPPEVQQLVNRGYAVQNNNADLMRGFVRPTERELFLPFKEEERMAAGGRVPGYAFGGQFRGVAKAVDGAKINDAKDLIKDLPRGGGFGLSPILKMIRENPEIFNKIRGAAGTSPNAAAAVESRPSLMGYSRPTASNVRAMLGLPEEERMAAGRFLSGGGDGTSDSIPANINGKQPARLADGEFVIDARTVSEIGNGSSKAGAKKLYAMMDRVHAERRKAQRGKPSKADRYLPA